MKRLIKKIIRAILCFWAFLLFIPNANAETVDMTFSTFRTYLQSYNINYNSEIYTTTDGVNTVMNAVADGFPFEWVTNYTNKCSGNTIITGRFRFDGNPNLTYDFINDNIKDVYYSPNISGVTSTPCSWSVNPNNLQVSFTCSTNQPNNNFIVGGHWRYRTGSFSTFYVVYRNMNITCDNSASAIIDSNNQNTQSIINNNNNNTQNIINNNNQNTQDIINSSGSNTQSIIDNQNDNTQQTIDSQKVCKYIDKNDIKENNKYLNSTGVVNSANGVGITDYINILSSDISVISPVNGSANTCFYNSNKELISCTNLNGVSGTLTIPSNSQYMRSTISVSQNRPTFNVCTNGNQSLNNTLTDDSIPDIDINVDVSSSTPISDLLTMPLTILNTLIQTLSDTCSNYSIPFFYNTTITFPCFTVSDYLGSNITNYIDLFICLYMCYNIAMLIVTIFEDITSLNDIFNSLYEPKHAYSGYQPRHAKGGAN